jgi:prenyltransferase beta subunit
MSPLACLLLALAPQDAVLDFVERHARPDGGYGWADEPTSHLTATWAAVGIYSLLDRAPPRRDALAEIARTRHPYRGPHAESRRHAAELRTFVIQQVETLRRLGADVSAFRDEVRAWIRPAPYATTYEKSGSPLFRQETAILEARELLGEPVSALDPALADYVLSRRRPDGSFHNGPAADGSGGHVLHTLRGLEALRRLDRLDRREETAAWLRARQLPAGGFAPEPGAADGVEATWAAVRALALLGFSPADPARAVDYLLSAGNADGGFGPRPGRASDLETTLRALEALRTLGALGRLASSPRRAAPEPERLPAGLKVFTIQIQAPGRGSPSDAVELARSLGIHLWGAKNAPPGWIARAQELAKARGVPVTFFAGDEEYGIFVSLPGHGTYSHLADPIAPAGADAGASMAGRVVPWAEFREARIGALERAGGRMVWQICDNEELACALLDDSLGRPGYAAIATFHMKQNFVDFLPSLLRYRDVLPFVSLQDAHGEEPWWWTDDLAGHRTLFLAKEPTWEGWLEALRLNWVVAVRQDAVTRGRLRLLGGTEAARRLVGSPSAVRRPPAVVAVLGPDDAFEEGRPAKGRSVRIRVARTNNPQGAALEPLAELVSLSADGAALRWETVEKKAGRAGLADVFHVAPLPEGAKSVVARVRLLETGEATELSVPVP